MFRRHSNVRWQSEQNRRSHFRKVLKESGVEGHFSLGLLLSQPVDPLQQLLQLLSIQSQSFQTGLHPASFAQEMDGHTEFGDKSGEVGAQD